MVMGHTLYKVDKQSTDRPVLFMVENTDDNDSPRRAAIQQMRLATWASLNEEARGHLISVAENLQEELDTVPVVAQSILDSIRGMAPSEVTVEFGVELGGICGLPLIT